MKGALPDHTRNKSLIFARLSRENIGYIRLSTNGEKMLTTLDFSSIIKERYQS